MRPTVRITADGSHTLYVPEIDETYHSIYGAISESTFIFIEQGLKFCCKDTIRVLEIGFGTGLNTLLTAMEANRTQKKIHYTTLEQYPVPLSDTMVLNYSELLETDTDFFDKIQHAPWETDVVINPFFVLHKVKTDFTTCALTGMYDVIYFDVFSPEKQPELWTEYGFQKIIEHCNPNAVLTTYCAKGVVRRALQKVGFRVERLPGPPGKREVIRAVKDRKTVRNNSLLSSAFFVSFAFLIIRV
jgi:tRNA U34 5-methylaminomethyl-2-thiouridine-forming methyltransferase MnmC